MGNLVADVPEVRMEHVDNGLPTGSLKGVRWQKSSASDLDGNCVALAKLPDGDIAVRNSRNPSAPALIYTRAEIAAFLRGAKDGDFDNLI